MRNLKFVVSALAILLAGALAAGLAARAVVAPRAGETVSAGVLSIPSVLGQAADEALFYPWSLYGMQELTPVPVAELGGGDLLSCIVCFDLLGVDADGERLAAAQMWTGGEGALSKAGWLAYVKGFPAVLSDGGAPVSLDYALGNTNPMGISWVVRPREEAELSERQRQAAMDKVKDDLAGMLWYMRDPVGDCRSDLMALLEAFIRRFYEMGLGYFEQVEQLIRLLYEQYGQGAAYDYAERADSDGPAGEREPPPLSLEELLAQGQGEYVDIQFISTPRQAVLLFNAGGMVVGVYYDAQLERYSGFGVSA